MTIRGLRCIQLDFADDVFRYNGGAPKGEYLRKGQGSFRSEQLVNIYRNNYFSSLTEALRATYGCVERLVGANFFQQLCHDFIKQSGINSSDLTEFGAQFSDFLSSVSTLKDHEYLVDIAKLEWLYERAYHSQEIGLLNPSALERSASETDSDVQIKLHPSAQVITSDFPLYDIWQLDNDSPALDLSKGGQSLLIFRKAFNVKIALLSQSELHWFHLLMQNKTLGSILSSMPESSHMEMHQFVAKYIHLQVIVGLENI